MHTQDGDFMERPILTKLLTKTEISGLLDCFSPVKKEYRKGEVIIFASSSDRDILGMIENGTAHLVTSNADGQRRIMDYYEKGGFFGRGLLPANSQKPFYVVAKTPCTVYFVNYHKLITCCQNTCEKHTKIIDYLFSYLSWKTNMHIDILEQQSLRDRILLYFDYLRIQNQTGFFRLPLSYTDLADYLAVNRSAMMRELKKMKEEELIKTKKNFVYLS